MVKTQVLILVPTWELFFLAGQQNSKVEEFTNFCYLNKSLNNYPDLFPLLS
jgi:hypothetical protein